MFKKISNIQYIMSRNGLNTLNSNPGRATSAPGFSGGNLQKAVTELKSYTEGVRKTKPSQKMLDLLEQHNIISKSGGGRPPAPTTAVMPPRKNFRGGKVNRLKKANQWSDFSKTNAYDGIDLMAYGADAYNKATNPVGYAAQKALFGGEYQSAGKVNRLKKANQWSEFSKRNAYDGIDLGSYGYDAYNKSVNPVGYAAQKALLGKGYASAGAYQKAGGYASAGSAPKAPSKWIQHVKAFAKQHNISYRDALKEASASYHANK
jgi:hypothetical protein